MPISKPLGQRRECLPECGSTRIIPGSHLLPPPARKIPGGGTMLDEHPEYAAYERQEIPIPMREGEILLFDGLLFHTVGTNETDRTRMSVSFAFRSVDNLKKRTTRVLQFYYVARDSTRATNQDPSRS
ncbi:MAG: phytanoyl-CoA dioxygenase family protein [Pseudonocardiales bacterium]|nr:phytanoyl-CoA dioxygenase family protein [Pseudonocardiales bacterium]